MKKTFLNKFFLAIVILSFLLKVQYVLIPNILGGGFPYNEYLDISVYLADFAFFGILFYIIYNENIILSTILQLFHVKQNKEILVLPIFILIIAGISVFFSYNLELSLRQLLFLFEGIILYFIIIFLYVFHVKHAKNNVSCETTWSFLIKGVYYFAFLNAFLAIIQFIQQKDLSLYFLGESHLHTGLENIATVSFFGHKLLRAYGLFPHPNILAAFLLLSWFFLRIFNVSRETNAHTYKKMFHVKHQLFLVLFSAFILFLSFKKSFNEREYSLLEYVKTNTISIFGNGIGTSYLQEASLLKTSLQNNWILQPAHSFYFIILSEIGFLGAISMVLFLLTILWSKSEKMFHVKQGQGISSLAFCIIILALGDHFFITIPQGIFIFWIFSAFAATRVLYIDKIK